MEQGVATARIRANQPGIVTWKIPKKLQRHIHHQLRDAIRQPPTPPTSPTPTTPRPAGAGATTRTSSKQTSKETREKCPSVATSGTSLREIPTGKQADKFHPTKSNAPINEEKRRWKARSSETMEANQMGTRGWPNKEPSCV